MNVQMTWTLPAGNVQNKLTGLILIYGLGIMVWAQWLSTPARRILFFATLPSVLFLLLLRMSRCWVVGGRLRIRNAARAVLTVDLGEIETLKWQAVRGLGVGLVAVVGADGSHYPMWSTLGTNGSSPHFQANLKSILAETGWRGAGSRVGRDPNGDGSEEVIG